MLRRKMGCGIVVFEKGLQLRSARLRSKQERFAEEKLWKNKKLKLVVTK